MAWEPSWQPAEPGRVEGRGRELGRRLVAGDVAAEPGAERQAVAGLDHRAVEPGGGGHQPVHVRPARQVHGGRRDLVGDAERARVGVRERGGLAASRAPAPSGRARGSRRPAPSPGRPARTPSRAGPSPPAAGRRPARPSRPAGRRPGRRPSRSVTTRGQGLATDRGLEPVPHPLGAEQPPVRRGLQPHRVLPEPQGHRRGHRRVGEARDEAMHGRGVDGGRRRHQGQLHPRVVAEVGVAERRRRLPSGRPARPSCGGVTTKPSRWKVTTPSVGVLPSDRSRRSTRVARRDWSSCLTGSSLAPPV